MNCYKIMAFVPDQGTQEVRGVELTDVGRVVEQLLRQGIERVVISPDGADAADSSAGRE